MERGPSRKPILVTGSHRSGTTWVGRMLAASGEAGYMHEPFNPNRAPGWLARPLPRWFMYLDDHNAGPYEPAITRAVDMRYPLAAGLAPPRPKRIPHQLREWKDSLVYRARKLRPLLKDPIALFSTEWLARTYDMNVVVMIRHPAAFVGSIKRLNWGFDYEREWLAQEPLMRDLLGPFANDFRGYEGEVDLVGEGIVMWNAMYHAVDKLRARHPEWSFTKLEDLASDPETGFRDLYRATGLSWDEKARAAMLATAAEGNPGEVSRRQRRSIRRDSRAATGTWAKRLTPEEIERVRLETAKVARLFYDDSTWETRTRT